MSSIEPSAMEDAQTLISGNSSPGKAAQSNDKEVFGDAGLKAAPAPGKGFPGAEPGAKPEVLDKLRRLRDFDDNRERWQGLLKRRSSELGTDVLKISSPGSKLDPIARIALDRLCATMLYREKAGREAADPYAELKEDALKQDALKQLEGEVREMAAKLGADIVKHGIATEVKKVTDRLNARRMTDGRRWVLATAYVRLLSKLLDRAGDVEELMRDDLGVAEQVMLDLEADDGPVDTLSRMVAKAVMERNRIGMSVEAEGGVSPTMLQIVSQQVRRSI